MKNKRVTTARRFYWLALFGTTARQRTTVIVGELPVLPSSLRVSAETHTIRRTVMIVSTSYDKQDFLRAEDYWYLMILLHTSVSGRTKINGQCPAQLQDTWSRDFYEFPIKTPVDGCSHRAVRAVSLRK